MSTSIVSKAPLRQVKDVRELLSNENARNQLASVAAKHMNPERMMRVVANAIRTTGGSMRYRRFMQSSP